MKAFNVADTILLRKIHFSTFPTLLFRAIDAGFLSLPCKNTSKNDAKQLLIDQFDTVSISYESYKSCFCWPILANFSGSTHMLLLNMGAVQATKAISPLSSMRMNHFPFTCHL